jgi:ferrous iron transport protein A
LNSESAFTPYTIGDLSSGASGVVTRLRGGKDFASRVIALGLTIGAEVTVLQNYGWGPVIVTVRGARVALGRGEAQRIQVELR